ncbi:MAG TPA: PAS domain-containing protein [Planctomycetota bacterium]|nr:PAS domain-containing protein [Planctomycetota bacterium]
MDRPLRDRVIEPGVMQPSAVAGALFEFNRVLDGIGDSLFVLDGCFRCVFANRVATTLLGKGREELTGKPIAEVLGELCGSELEQRCRQVLQSGTRQVLEVCNAATNRWYEFRIDRTDVGLTILVADVSARKLSEQTLENVLCRINDHLVVYDLQWRYTYVNDKAAQVLGRPKDQLLGRCIWDLFPDAVGNQYYRELHEARAEQKIIRSEHYYAPFKKWFENIIYPAADGVTVFTTDVTWRKQAEESIRAAEREVRQSRDVLSLAMRGGRMGAWSRNLQTNEVWWSRELEEIFGLEPGGFAGTESGFFGLVHEDDRAAVAQAVETALLEHTDYAVEFRFRHASGQWRWMEGRGKGVYDNCGKPGMLYGIGIDVTERHMAEQEVKSGRERLQLISDTAPVYIANCDCERRFKFVNRAYAQRFGLRPEDVTGKHVSEVLGEEAFQTIRPYIDQVLMGKHIEFELQIHLKNGTSPWIQCRYAPEYNGKGQVQGWVSVVLDITSRKQTEAALLEAGRRKDEFLAMLSHELRNPLGPIRNGVYLLRKLGTGEERCERIWSMIERQAGHMSRIVDDLLDVSRITRGKILLRREIFNICELVRATAQDYSPEFEKKKITLAVADPGVAVFVNADRTRLAQCIGNLLHNAQKFTGTGGTTRIVVDCTATIVTISVADNGMGMDKGLQERLFQPFAQADHSLERGFGGLGLGLSLVKGLVTLHGGTVSAFSEGPGRGSLFSLSIPTVSPARANADTQRQNQAAPARTILVVEDNADAAESIQMILSLAGHHVTVAASADEALDKIKMCAPDAIICDIGLPGKMSGYDLARAIRAKAEHARTLLIALTGYGQEEDRCAALNAGFDRHLAKPVDPARIEQIIYEAAP